MPGFLILDGPHMVNLLLSIAILTGFPPEVTAINVIGAILRLSLSLFITGSLRITVN